MVKQAERRQLTHCRSINELERIHNRYVDRINNHPTNQDIKIKDVDYPVPPIVGTEHIIPLTHSRELIREGKKQHHCVAMYHRLILKGTCYIYKVIKPERATLEIRITPNGKYHIAQLKLDKNEEPSMDTKEAVLQWLMTADKIKDTFLLSKKA